MPLGILDLRALRRYYRKAAIDVVAAIVDLPAASTLSLIVGNTPATGAEGSIFIDRGTSIRLIWFQADLVTSAVAGSRNVGLSINLKDYGKTIVIRSNVTQAAGSERTWIFERGYPSPGVDSAFNAGPIGQFLPELPLRGPFTLSTSTLSMDPGDHFTAGNFFILFEVIS